MARRSKENAIDWDAIEVAYRLGAKSNTQLANEFGVECSSIGRRAKRCGWVSGRLREAASRPRIRAAAPLPFGDGLSLALECYRRAMVSSGEERVVDLMLGSIHAGQGHIMLDGLPYDPELDEIHREYSLGRGRVDIAIVRRDGSVTLIEAKDGSQGMREVVGGIGQVCMYAVHESFYRGTPHSKVSKALAFSSTGNPSKDMMIEMACRSAGVRPIQLGNAEAQLDVIIGMFERAGAEQ